MPPKQATKGQKQIYADNQETILYHTYAAVAFSAWYLLSFLLSSLLGLTDETIFALKYVVFIIVSFGISFGCLYIFKYMAVAKFSGNTVVDGGLDLSISGGVADYVRDVIYINFIVQLLSAFSNWFWALYAVVPIYATYKVTTSFILPWIFAPAPEVDEEQEEKKQRKMDRKMRRSAM
ncbi:hypothetical protein TYRP_004911 [Tyrophagus putrescentiae]|nr:hypothetical protein TYRP_004911 [Tyrophagus putrescentiae]